MKIIQLYTDGAALRNPGGPGGWGFILQYKDFERVGYGGVRNTTNNRMELFAVIQGLLRLTEPCTVELYSDSKYVVAGVQSVLHKAPRRNQDMWFEFVEVSRNHTIHPHWVRGHAGHRENERADALATEGLRPYALEFNLEYRINPGLHEQKCTEWYQNLLKINAGHLYNSKENSLFRVNNPRKTKNADPEDEPYTKEDENEKAYQTLKEA